MKSFFSFLGEAFLQIAEVLKEINAQILDNVRSRINRALALTPVNYTALFLMTWLIFAADKNFPFRTAHSARVESRQRFESLAGAL